MQQLSLFDFGEESPKPEKKNKSSESSVEQTESTPDNDNNSDIETEDIPIVDKGKIPVIDEQGSSSPIPNPPVPASIEKSSEATTEQSEIADEVPALEAQEEVNAKEDEKPADSIESAQSPNEQSDNEVDSPSEPRKSLPEVQATNQHQPEPTGETDQKTNELHRPLSTQGEETKTLTTGKISYEVNAPNEQSNNDAVFSNDQIGVKKVTIKANSDKESNTPVAPPSHQKASADKDPEQPKAEKQPTTLDTSFSPEEFESSSSQVTEESQEQPIENQLSEGAEEENESTQDSIIEKSTAAEPAQADQPASEDDDNEHINPNNNHRKPYYIEDQTVPVRKRGRKSFKEIDAEVDLINIPPDEELFQKQYYPISVVAKWFRVNNSLLRFWENEFKILKPKKNKKGDRFFRPEDVKNLQLIYYLLRQKKLTINGAIKHLKSYKEQTEVNMQLIQTLNEFKGFLLELRAATEK